MNKENIIKVRVTDREKLQIQERAKSEGITVSQLIRRQVIAEPVTDAIAATLQVKRDHVKQITILGRNLNRLLLEYHKFGIVNKEELILISAAIRSVYDR